MADRAKAVGQLSSRPPPLCHARAGWRDIRHLGMHKAVEQEVVVTDLRENDFAGLVEPRLGYLKKMSSEAAATRVNFT